MLLQGLLCTKYLTSVSMYTSVDFEQENRNPEKSNHKPDSLPFYLLFSLLNLHLTAFLHNGWHSGANTQLQNCSMHLRRY